ncbi:MAG: FeoB-associated Cys-rich membrane protein [Clostridiales bacterium]|jgi:hypothetical protein|nr:FeoB-associated Cys-rich membrane protein [Clostridiales bacterium]
MSTVIIGGLLAAYLVFVAAKALKAARKGKSCRAGACSRCESCGKYLT